MFHEEIYQTYRRKILIACIEKFKMDRFHLDLMNFFLPCQCFNFGMPVYLHPPMSNRFNIIVCAHLAESGNF